MATEFRYEGVIDARPKLTSQEVDPVPALLERTIRRRGDLVKPARIRQAAKEIVEIAIPIRI
jgi:hypothetical protein